MLQNIPKEKILEIVRLGPTLPAKVAKQLGGGGDTLLVGAILSTLIGSGEVFVSTLKVGGSPLYYIPEHESKLEEFTNYLNEKDKRAFSLLKESKVLVDSTLDPLTRVSLRTIKDFAKPLELDISGQKVLFWRYYLVSRDEATVIAKNLSSGAHIQAPSQPLQKEIPKIQTVSKPIVSEPSKPVVSAQALPSADTSSLKASDDTKHTVHKHKDVHKDKEPRTHSELPIHLESSKEQVEHPIEHHKADAGLKDKILHDTSLKTPKEKPAKAQYDFYSLILEHVSKKGLDLISKEKIKKSEYNLILKNHSNNEYIYCKAKDKSTISEGDLAPALIFAQNKKMPCLFLSTGTLTKNAELMIGKEFSGMTFEKMATASSNI